MTEGYELDRERVCECPDLRELFSSREEARQLEGRVSQYRPEADLTNPRDDDLKFLLDYKRVAEQFQEATKRYYATLGNLALKGKLKFKMRKPEEKDVSYEEAVRLAAEVKNVVITMHCANCDKIVDSIGD